MNKEPNKTSAEKKASGKDTAENTAESYEDAITELQDILDKLQNGDVNVDELAEQVTRSTELINYCKKKINAAEMKVTEIVDAIEETEKSNA